ncbi:MAG: hypothetical protein ABSB87_18875, partial [Terriglobales bacterium]
MKSTAHRRLTLRNPLLLLCVVLFVLSVWGHAAELRVPVSVEAGQGFSIPVESSAQAIFYLLGPDHVVKRTLNSGSEVQIQSSDVQSA